MQRSFERTKEVIYSNLPKLFSVTKIADLKIQRGESKQLAQAPGYYDNNVFYYNLYDKPYNKRMVDWLFIHEGVPGHHYQSSIIGQTKVSDVQQLFFCMEASPGGWELILKNWGKNLAPIKHLMTS